ncbi:MAG: M48 family metalloprotease [Bryobacteraceae bacterium]|nr:M48 family metalloprotease [Bryobacteraceae bacterium]MDW8379973.1 M48 family metalloprotease [Bryobacterales bacterium]
MLTFSLVLASTPWVSAQVLKLNDKQEAEVGRLAAAQLESEQPLFLDAKTNDYVQSLAIRLGRHSGRPGLRYTARILQSDDVHALALPGGYIYVTRGLIEMTASEAELAGVLAHEIGHIAARQHATKIRRAQLASLGVSFLGPLMGGGIRVAAAVRGGKTGARGLFMRFSKADEAEADRLAAKILYDAGYDPTAMLSFQRRVTSLNEDQSSLVSKYISSHPSFQERSDHIQDLIESLPKRNDWRENREEFAAIQKQIQAVKPPASKSTSEAALSLFDLAGPETDTPETRARYVASLFAPIFYQALGHEPRYDYITNFDFDGDWIGDNNWENAAKSKYPLQAWVYYSVRETSTHYFLHYAVFHPRDYKGGVGKGTLFSRVLRTGVKPAAKVDPTGRAQEIALAHENDLEGCLLVVAKNGDDPRDGQVVFLETLAHNSFLKYLPPGQHKEGFGNFSLQGRRVKLYIEPRGHGIEAYGPTEAQQKHTLLVYTFLGLAETPSEDLTKATGYNLAPIATTLWPEALRGVTPTYAETEDYGLFLLEEVGPDGKVFERKMNLGRIGSAFRGKVGGANLARPPWAWFDGKDKNQPLGEWFFDPARTIRRHFDLPPDFSVAYLYAWPPETAAATATPSP